MFTLSPLTTPAYRLRRGSYTAQRPQPPARARRRPLQGMARPRVSALLARSSPRPRPRFWVAGRVEHPEYNDALAFNAIEDGVGELRSDRTQYVT